MRSHRILAFAALIVVLASICSAASDDKPKRLTEDERKTLLRDLTAETPYVRRLFPLGKVGLKVEDGVVSPSEAEVRQMVADTGPAAKPGDRAKITSIVFKKKGIIFEINGGPVKRKKWYERIQLESVGGMTTPANPNDKDPNNVYVNARGSYVALVFKDDVPELTTDQVKKMLSPVLDFNAHSQAEAYAKSLPPKIQEALKNHKALVGMDREMVTYAKGRAPRKHRETENGTEYEEWIYGEPPSDVEFIRFVGDNVVRIETMKVDGEKIVRTKKEVDLDKDMSAMAKKDDAAAEKPAENAPSLLRPGEKPIDVRSTTAAPSAPPGSKKPPLQQPDATGPPPDVNQGRPDAGPPALGPPHL